MSIDVQNPIPARVIEFVTRAGVWQIADNRLKARAACIQFLQRVPPSVRRFVMTEKRLLLIAPQLGSPGSANSFRIPPGCSHVQLVQLGSALESMPLHASIYVLAKCVANAIQSDDPQIREMSTEELIVFWGFRPEVAAVMKSRNPHSGKNLAELASAHVSQAVN